MNIKSRFYFRWQGLCIIIFSVFMYSCIDGDESNSSKISSYVSSERSQEGTINVDGVTKNIFFDVRISKIDPHDCGNKNIRKLQVRAYYIDTKNDALTLTVFYDAEQQEVVLDLSEPAFRCQEENPDFVIRNTLYVKNDDKSEVDEASSGIITFDYKSGFYIQFNDVSTRNGILLNGNLQKNMNEVTISI